MEHYELWILRLLSAAGILHPKGSYLLGHCRSPALRVSGVAARQTPAYIRRISAKRA
jgi:hypothetical protein